MQQIIKLDANKYQLAMWNTYLMSMFYLKYWSNHPEILQPLNFMTLFDCSYKQGLTLSHNLLVLPYSTDHISY